MKRQQVTAGTIFPSASQVVVNGGSFAASQTTNVTSAGTDQMYKLFNHVAPHAILNAGGRADPVRCYPGTREEILADFNGWIDAYTERTHPLRWLSGPAGAGKSAIVQSIAEGCLKRKVHMANFFFFRGDTTRNTAGPLVATLLYQILDFYPQTAKLVADVIARKPRIFEASIEEQFNLLITNHIDQMRQSSATHQKAIVLLIDGLDECDSESKQHQQAVLRALNNLVTVENSPFIALVASRAEPQIVMAFNTFSMLGTSVRNTFLDENYRPSKDIHLFVVAEFDRIRRTHHLGHTLHPHWPSSDVVLDIVRKSSGQFIFAATVMRFLANSPASPVYNLEKVQGLRPPRHSSPFSELDAVYTYILSQAEDKKAVRDILFTHLLLQHGEDSPKSTRMYHLAPVVLATLGYDIRNIDSYLADLTAVLRFNHRTNKLIFYHASLTDFLRDGSRSGEFHIDSAALATEYAPSFFREIKNYDFLRLYIVVLRLVNEPSSDLTNALIQCNMLFEGYPTEIDFWTRSLFESIHKLYFLHDVQVYKELISRWIIRFHDCGVMMSEEVIDAIPFAREISPYQKVPIQKSDKVFPWWRGLFQQASKPRKVFKNISAAPPGVSSNLDKR